MWTMVIISMFIVLPKYGSFLKFCISFSQSGLVKECIQYGHIRNIVHLYTIGYVIDLIWDITAIGCLWVEYDRIEITIILGNC